MTGKSDALDYDWLIIGSGFGGSVSALRLAEKGYKVGVLEAGRRYRDEDYAKSTWDLRRFLWAPSLGLRGIFRLTPFKDVFIASGSAVGGGSVVYANTLYRAAPPFFANPQWVGLNDWAAALAPHYDTAEKMLGVQTVPRESDGQQLLQEVGRHFNVEGTFDRQDEAGVDLGQPVEDVFLAEHVPAGDCRTQDGERQRLDGLARHRGVTQVPGLDARTASVRAIRPEEAEATLVAVEPARQPAEHAVGRVFRRHQFHLVTRGHRCGIDHVDVRSPMVPAAARNG